MSYKIVDHIINECLFTAEEKLVMVSLARHANDENRLAWPSIYTIAGESSLARRTVQRKLRKLEETGVIADVTDYYEDPTGKRKRVAKYGGKGNSTRYRIATEAEISQRLIERYKRERKMKERPIGADKSVMVTLLTASGVHA